MQKAGNWGIMEKMQIWLLPSCLIIRENIVEKYYEKKTFWIHKRIWWIWWNVYANSTALPMTPCPTLNPLDYVVRVVFRKRLYCPIVPFLHRKIGEAQVESNKTYLENKVTWSAWVLLSFQEIQICFLSALQVMNDSMVIRSRFASTTLNFFLLKISDLYLWEVG